jgi:hypothetical protein
MIDFQSVHIQLGLQEVNMKNILILFVIIIFLAGCTAGMNRLQDTQNAKGNTAGFFAGFWHGLISIFTLIISLFTDKISIYEVHNSGFWYDLGFLLGAGTLTGGTLWSKKRRK